MTESFYWVYTTHNNRDQALALCRQLLQEKLIACANLGSEMSSIYQWEGQVECTKEWPLILKTSSAKYVALEKRVQELHPYDCPALLALPVKEGAQNYLNWMQEQLKN